MTAKPRKIANSEPAKPLKEKRKPGRPPVYKPEFNELARLRCLLGQTNQELARTFGVSEIAIERWIRTIPEFSRSVKAGREGADAEVASALYLKATGRYIEAKTLEDGTVVEYMARMAPDTTAGIFWLKNRQRRDWREKHEVHNTNTTDTKVTFTLSPEAKAHLEEVRRLLGPDPSHADASASASPAGGEAGNGKAEGNGSVH